MKRSPNPNVPEEVRRAIQRGNRTTDTHATEIAVLDADIAVLDAEVFALQGDVVVIDGRLDALEALAEAYSAETDSATAIGNLIYVKSNGHVDLAANYAPAQRVAGIAVTAAASGHSVNFATDAKITLSDWTAIVGVSQLTPGANYYLPAQTDAPEVPPSYSGVGGTGNRLALISVTTTATYNGYITYLVNGNKTETTAYFAAQTVSGKEIRFDFGVGSVKRITEATWYQSNTTPRGLWQWQGSGNGTTWTSLGASFTLGGMTVQVQTTLADNDRGYRYYRLLGISGSTTSSGYVREIEFKITNYIAIPNPGMISSVAPTNAGEYVVRIGRAVSTTTLDIEIQQSIML